MRKVLSGVLAAAAVSFMYAGAAHAAVTFTLGNNPGSNEENILLGTAQTGTSINGTTNQSGVGVLFTTNTGTLVSQGNGQAQLEAGTGNVTNVTISLPGHTFTDLIFNPSHGSGSATITANTTAGASTFTEALGNGENFLTIVSTGGTLINSVMIQAAAGFDSLQQIRLSGISSPTGGGGGGPVPEPATLALFGLGLVGLGAYRRSRKT